MSKKINLVGMRFGRLFVLSEGEPIKGHSYFECVCDCGSVAIVAARHLQSSATKSCGCLRSDTKNNLSHGKRFTAEYRIWQGIIQRCTNKNRPSWEGYGGRGICVCERWLVFENFYSDMGPRPTSKHSIDRIDNDGSYSQDNCRWATQSEQSKNQRPRRSAELFDIDGVVMTLNAWAAHSGRSPATVRQKWQKWRNKGVSFKDVLLSTNKRKLCIR